GEDAPVLVRNCRISGFDNGIEIVGMDVKSVAVPCGRLLFRDNRIEECDIGIWAAGQINDALIVGNRLVGCFTASMRLDLIAGSSGILLANNSIKARSHCLKITGLTRGVKQLEIRNNVLIAEAGLDMVRDGGVPGIPTGWRIDHNWRQVRQPAA